MIKIGNRTVVATFPNLQVPLGERVEIALQSHVHGLPNGLLTVDFTDDGGAAGMSYNGLSFVLKNWNSELGNSTPAPVPLVHLAVGGVLEAMITSQKHPSHHLLSIQLLHKQ